MWLTPSVLPDISPTRREIGWADALRFIRTVIIDRAFATFKIAERRLRVDLPTCGGDARQGREGLAAHENI